MLLTKSHYIQAQQCPKLLWLNKHRPDLKNDKGSKVDSLFESGITVGHCAKELFPGGEEIKYQPGNYKGMAHETQMLVDQGINTIYEAAFKANNIFAMADILYKTPKGWELYEVKSSTSTKEVHIMDAAVQYYVMNETIKISKIFIVHINNQYVRQGELDVHALFSLEDITEKVVALQASIRQNMKAIEVMLSSDLPEIDIGPHCLGEYTCDFHDHCWKHIPYPSVFNLYNLRSNKKFEMYNNGVIKLEDIPVEYELSDTQQLQVQSTLNNQVFLDNNKIRDFLDTIEYPISFFDFETFQNAIPRFEGQNPYAQMPFQYSLHIQEQTGDIIHKEFLGDENKDPRRELAEQMLSDLPVTGSIVVFNQTFEIGQIKGLAKLFPDLEKKLLKLLSRIVDLLVPFRQIAYYHPDFNGSFSIKSVLPALFPNDPELDYKQLEIQNGGQAMDTFANLYLLKDKQQRDVIRKNLLAYCRLDTLAMVRIWEKLREPKD